MAGTDAPTPAQGADRRQPGRPRQPATRWSARRKADAVLRVLRGEPLRALAEELGLDAERLARWRDEFVRAGREALKGRRPDRDRVQRALRQAELTIGQLTLENELLRAAAGPARSGRAAAAGRGRGARARPTDGLRPAPPEDD